MPIAILGTPLAGGRFLVERLRHAGLAAVPAGAAGSAVPAGLAAVNAAILARFGGGWDRPPDWPAGWEAGPVVEPFRPAAAALCPGTGEWVWSDPATTLTWPFWRRTVAGLRPLVVVRNPLEVMISLHARHGCSAAAALGIVRVYLRAVVENTTPSTRVVTHFGAHARDTRAETARLATALGREAGPGPGDDRGFQPCLRHARFSARHLVEFGLPADIAADYALLCDEARFADDEPSHAGCTVDDRAIDWLRDGLTGAGAAAGALGDAAIDGGALRLLRAEITALREALAARDEELWDQLDDIRLAQPPRQVAPERALYNTVVKGCRQLVRDRVPRGAVVAVGSKGDDDLLRCRGREGWHFPRAAGGSYAGWYPAGDLAAIAHLESLRAEGATHLLVPETYAWWLTTYAGFHRHLATQHELVERRAGAGVLYALVGRPPAPTDGDDAVARAERLAAALGRPPHVLDLGAGERLAAIVPGATVFAPPVTSPPLPYLDASVDIVAVAGVSADVVAEARRVARLAVVECGDTPRWDWCGEPPALALPSVTVIVPVFNQWPVTRGCLAALWATVPPESDLEVIVVDDGSTDVTPAALASLVAVEPRLRVLRNPATLGFVGSCNRAAAAARGDVLVFLNNDTVPLPGWLQALVGSLAELPRAGAIGGRVLFPDGRLQEAGGIVFADGSACHFGRGEADATAPLFQQVRRVDYVSGALLATPRSVFHACGGFDPDYAPGYYEDTDYCFRLREAGHEVYYQPEAVVVHYEGATAGTDPAAGMKRHQEINRQRFLARHAAALAAQPPRPDSIVGDDWRMLFHRGSGRRDR